MTLTSINPVIWFKTDPRKALWHLKWNQLSPQVAITRQDRSFYNETLKCITPAYVLNDQLSLKEARRCQTHTKEISVEPRVDQENNPKEERNRWEGKVVIYKSTAAFSEKKAKKDIKTQYTSQHSSHSLSVIQHVISVRTAEHHESHNKK